MNYVRYISIFLLQIACFCVFAESVNNTSLSLTIERIKHLNKPIFIRLDSAAGDLIDFNAPESSAIALKVVTPESESITTVFEQLVPGRYFIRVFQDLNGNRQLDVSDGGYPIEPWGLSNNPILFDDPAIEEVAFDIQDSVNNQQSISLRERKSRKRRKR